MRRLGRIVTTTGIGLLSFAGVAVAQQPPTGAQAPGTTQAPGDTQAPAVRTVGEVMSATATVKKIDQKKREVTLTDEGGNEFVVNVPKDVTGLDTMKKGDKVNITYHQSLALSLKKGGAPSGTSEAQLSERIPGNQPGGVVGRQITTSAKVTKVDPDANKLTIRDAKGKTDTINVSDPAMQSDLKQLKPGDRIQAVYTEAIAMAVTPKNKE